MIEFRPYAPPSFFTTQGAWAKRRQLERKGFPHDLRNWRFVTLTMDPKKYPDPKVAWEIGKRHLRQFVYLLKQRYGIKRWCWKMEFHEPDECGRVFAHWHLLFDYKQRLDKDEIHTLWGKGRTNIKRIDNQTFEYLFKYATKVVEQIPDWVLNLKVIRLFQTSSGFFPASSKTKQKDETASPRLCVDDHDTKTQNNDDVTTEGLVKKATRNCTETIGERLQRWSRYIVSRTISQKGTILRRTHEILCDSWGTLLVNLGELKIQLGLFNQPYNKINITENIIQTSCLIHIRKYLLAST